LVEHDVEGGANEEVEELDDGEADDEIAVQPAVDDEPIDGE
jgi:hypothetical protein